MLTAAHALLFCNMNSDRQFASSSPALGPSAGLVMGSQWEATFLQRCLCGCTLHAVTSQTSTAVSQGCRDTDTLEKDLYESGLMFVAHGANEELENRF